MKNLLAPRNASALTALAKPSTLLAFDFDGTLAPIVTAKERARMRRSTAHLLAQTSLLYPCAVISGRSRSDLLPRLQGAPVKFIVGNHGLEPFGVSRRVLHQVRRTREWLKRALVDWPDLDVEDKGYSLAIHYRRAQSQTLARRAILAAVTALPFPMRRVGGKCVVNLVPPGAPDKGVALGRLRAAERAQQVLYVGDDDTDEDVFVLDEPWLLTVRVGRSRTSAASYFLGDQPAIDELLSRLLRLRNSPSADLTSGRE